jgi:hypothetical protein
MKKTFFWWLRYLLLELGRLCLERTIWDQKPSGQWRRIFLENSKLALDFPI